MAAEDINGQALGVNPGQDAHVRDAAEVAADEGEIFLAGRLVAVPEGLELSEVGWQDGLHRADDHGLPIS